MQFYGKVKNEAVYLDNKIFVRWAIISIYRNSCLSQIVDHRLGLYTFHTTPSIFAIQLPVDICISVERKNMFHNFKSTPDLIQQYDT